MLGSGTAIEFEIGDVAGNTYTVLFPNVKFESESVVAPGQDQDVIETLTWRALYDATYNCQIHITRVVI